MWDSNQKNQPGHTEAKPPHPHQQKPNFTVIHPGSLGQHNEHIITGFTMISTRSLGQISIDATGFLHLRREEFSCLLVSQALPQSKPRSLGPKLRSTLEALLHIPNPGLLGPTKGIPPLGFVVYPAIHWHGFLGRPRQHNLGFTTTHTLAQGSLG